MFQFVALFFHLIQLRNLCIYFIDRLSFIWNPNWPCLIQPLLMNWLLSFPWAYLLLKLILSDSGFELVGTDLDRNVELLRVVRKKGLLAVGSESVELIHPQLLGISPTLRSNTSLFGGQIGKKLPSTSGTFMAFLHLFPNNVGYSLIKVWIFLFLKV